MPRNKLLLKLLVIATLLVDAVVFSTVERPDERTQLGLFALALVFSQIGLINTCCLMLPRNVWLGVPIACISTLAYAKVWSILQGNMETEEWVIIFAVYSVAIALPLGIIRMLGIRLARDIAAPGLRGGAAWLQFSVKDLLILTAVVGLLACGAQAMQARFDGESTEIVVFCVSLSFAAVSALWLMCGHANVVFRVSAFALLLILVLVLLFNVISRDWTLSEFVLLHSLLVAGSLAVIRLSGYRLVRRSSAAHDSDSNAGSPEQESASGHPELAGSGTAL